MRKYREKITRRLREIKFVQILEQRWQIFKRT